MRLDTFGYVWILSGDFGPLVLDTHYILDTFGYFWIRLDTRAMFGIQWKLFWILLDTYGYASAGRTAADKLTVQGRSPSPCPAGGRSLGDHGFMFRYCCAPTSGDFFERR